MWDMRETCRVSTATRVFTESVSISLAALKLNMYMALWMKKLRRFFSWEPGKTSTASG